ncbi:MAG: DNA-3-methyladenine glycosylase I [Bacteroidales bacterium]|jgi:DNA-3-methyladenine glycosylase I|nr:DNA-3-methyladenine glycosylase I [Bacteroidales bacterium]
MTKNRCDWAKKPLDIEYHDHEWGIPVHDDRKLFEYLLLDGFQAGLSWSTILSKRENFRKAFDAFDYRKIAGYNSKKIETLLQDQGIIRNKLKIKAAISNAQAFLKVQEEFDSFDRYIWSFTDGKTMVNHWRTIKEVPSTSNESDAMSKDLKKRGFTFVGSTICYAFMQAAGLVNDHLVTCFRYKEVLQ